MSSGWYVLHTKPRAEYLAAAELERDGWEVYLPRIKSPQDRIGHADSPLFPGYFFLRCDPDLLGWPTILNRHRVIGWVGFGGEIPRLPDAFVSNLMERIETIDGEGGLWQRFQAGDKVRVIGCNLDSLAEVVQDTFVSNAPVKVLMHFMGRLIQAKVQRLNLQPVQDSTDDLPRAPRRTRGGGRWIRGFGAPNPARA